MTKEKQIQTPEESQASHDLAEHISQEVLARVRSMVKWNGESVEYYDGVRNRKLRANQMYFRGMRDGQEDVRRVLRSCLFEVLATKEMIGVLER